MTNQELVKLFRDNERVTDGIMDLLRTNRVTPEKGEQIMLFLAGASAGLRQASIAGDWIEPAAAGWTFAAHHGDDV